jgi:hypothetical protein
MPEGSAKMVHDFEPRGERNTNAAAAVTAVGEAV